ncbi:hypothetical protein [Scytonema sp. NUACC21]
MVVRPPMCIALRTAYCYAIATALIASLNSIADLEFALRKQF